MEPQNTPATNGEPVVVVNNKNPNIVLLVIIAVVFILGIAAIIGIVSSGKQRPIVLSVQESTVVDTPAPPSMPTPVLEESAGATSQQELPVALERVTTPAPLYTALDSNMLSPHVNAAEMGKRYLATFTSHLPVGKTLPLTVSVKRAAKYYPVQTNPNANALVYFPSCFEHDCFNGKSLYPVSVQEGNALVAIDLEFKNTTTSMFYLNSFWMARFMIDGEYKTPKGSQVTKNITTGREERFPSPPSSYVGANDTQTYTFWVEVPHDTTSLSFMYGRTVYDMSLPEDKRYSVAPIFDSKELSIVLPLSFTGTPNATSTSTK